MAFPELPQLLSVLDQTPIVLGFRTVKAPVLHSVRGSRGERAQKSEKTLKKVHDGRLPEAGPRFASDNSLALLERNG